MNRTRTVLTAAAALTATVSLSVFAFHAVKADREDAQIIYDDSRASVQTDKMPVRSDRNVLNSDSYEPDMIMEHPEAPTDDELFAVKSYMYRESDYQAEPDDIDILNIVTLNEKRRVSADAAATGVLPSEPDSYLPETYADLEEEKIGPPIEIAENVTLIKENVEKPSPVFEDIKEEVTYRSAEVTTVYRPNDLMLYQSDPSLAGVIEAQYVPYNFSTPSLLPLNDDIPAETEASETQVSETVSDDMPEEVLPAPDLMIEQPEVANEVRAGYLVPSAFTGSEVFTANFDGVTQEIDAYTLVCMICSTEMSPSFSREALKAQAVAAYSYCKYHNVNGLVASVVVKYNVPEVIKSAVDEVFGQCAYYNGRVAQTVYTASTAGTTASAANVWGGGVPYLESVPTPIDELYDPNWGVTVQYTKDEMKGYIERYCGITLSDSPENWVVIDSYYDGKYVDNMIIDGQVSVTGRQFRERLMHFELKSWAFDVAYENETFTFTTYGYGHGVGMSQNGANIFGRQGYTYDQILAYYFPGVYIQ